MNNKNQALNEQRRRQTQFLDLAIALASVDDAREQLHVDNTEMFRWMQGEAFRQRYDAVLATLEDISERETRAARVQAARHLNEVASGKVQGITPAQRLQACNTLMREARLIARQPTRHDRPRSASNPPPPPNQPNRYAQIHPSIKEPEKSRLWAALQKDVRRAWEMNNATNTTITSTTITDNTIEPRRTPDSDHRPAGARELGEHVPRPADADHTHV